MAFSFSKRAKWALVLLLGLVAGGFLFFLKTPNAKETQATEAKPALIVTLTKPTYETWEERASLPQAMSSLGKKRSSRLRLAANKLCKCRPMWAIG